MTQVLWLLEIPQIPKEIHETFVLKVPILRQILKIRGVAQILYKFQFNQKSFIIVMWQSHGLKFGVQESYMTIKEKKWRVSAKYDRIYAWASLVEKV